MTINKVPSNKPSAPTGLTEETSSTPIAPLNLTEQAKVDPLAPVNLTELSKRDPLAPVNLTEKPKVDPVAPVNLPEIPKRDPLAPSNLTELSGSSPSNPSNLTEKPVSKPLAPVNLAELVDAGINRTLTPLFNFDASLGLPDSVTYSRSSSASYIESYKDPLGRSATRLTNDFAGSVENLSTYSENLTNAAWNATNASTVSSSEFTPDNNRNSVKLVANVGNALHSLFNGSVAMVSGNAYTFSVIAKASGLQYLQLSYSSAAHPTNQHANFDLINGVITANVSGVASMKYLSNGWYECSFTEVSNNTNSSNCLVILVDTPTATRGASFVGNGIDGILIYKAQTTQSSYLLPYVQTFDVAVTKAFTANPRYEEKGLLVEGISTNLSIRSQDISNSSWLPAGITKAGNSALAPDDSFSAGRITEDSSNAAHLLLSPSFSAVAGRTYSFTVFIKKQSSRNVTIGFQNTFGGSSASFFNLSTGVTNVASGAQVISAKQVEIANGWIRCEIQAIAEATSTSRGILYMTNESNVVSYQGDGQSTLLVWGCQVEELPFATSYIHTEGSTVTRAADVITSPIATINNELSISSKASSLGLQASAVAILDLATDANNFVRLSVSATGTDRFDIRNFGVLILGATGTSDLTGNNVRQTLTASRLIALGYSNGAVSVTDTSISVPAVTSVSIGRALQGGAIFYGNISNIEIYDLSLTANEVKKL